MKNEASDQPLYVSPSSAKSLWQEYRVYNDRLEFHTLLGTLEVPFDRIGGVAVVGSDLRRAVRAELTLSDFSPSLKLDWANFQEHVVIEKRGGVFVKRILFTPDDPQRFKAAVESAMSAFRARPPATL